MATGSEVQLRQAIINGCLAMNAAGMNHGTSGNISARYKHTMLITPSATAYSAMTPDKLAGMPLNGEYGSYSGELKPSTEWRFHLDILQARAEVNAVVHLHSTYCTALAIARKSIPSCHYMIAAFGGYDVRCSGYACFGSKALSDEALSALENRTACLLANHGMIALGESLDKALWRAVELENIAKQYYLSLAIGGPTLLTPLEIDEALSKFASYGHQDDHS